MFLLLILTIIVWVILNLPILKSKWSLMDIMATGIIMILEKIFGEKRLEKFEEILEKIFKMEEKR